MDIVALRKEIKNLYKKSLELERSHTIIELISLPEEVCRIIENDCELYVFDILVCIDNYGIIHTLKHHGNPVSEAKRGQIAVNELDFENLVDVLLRPDTVSRAGESKRTKLPLIQFVKEIEDLYFVVLELRIVSSSKKNKKSKLVFHTMYKKRKPNL